MQFEINTSKKHSNIEKDLFRNEMRTLNGILNNLIR